MIKNKLKELENKIKIKFNNTDLLKLSLIHKSLNNKENNEKLEFLGDRVLGLIISKKLLEIYPNDTEGAIDKKYASLVNKKTCINIAKNIGLIKYISLGSSYKDPSKPNEKIMSDTLEALIGAIYIDSGYKSSEKFVLFNWKSVLDNSELTPVDPKTRLQEFSLKTYKELPKYTTYKQSGPIHKPIFKVEVQIKNSKKLSGEGSTKKNAQQNAAKKLLTSLDIK